MVESTISDAEEPVKGLKDVRRSLSQSRALPPVDDWNPPFHGNFDMRIGSDGAWYYRGSVIARAPMVHLFATILRRDEDDCYYLVTPVEKVGVIVDDAPFMAVEMAVDGPGKDQKIEFRTNVEDVVPVGETNPLRFGLDDDSQGLKPYVLVRSRLEALVTRSLTYDLVELAVEHEIGGIAQLGVWSGGCFFPMAPVDDVNP